MTAPAAADAKAKKPDTTFGFDVRNGIGIILVFAGFVAELCVSVYDLVMTKYHPLGLRSTTTMWVGVVLFAIGVVLIFNRLRVK